MGEKVLMHKRKSKKRIKSGVKRLKKLLEETFFIIWTHSLIAEFRQQPSDPQEVFIAVFLVCFVAVFPQREARWGGFAPLTLPIRVFQEADQVFVALLLKSGPHELLDAAGR